ncbi:MAG: aminopeptidase P family protein [Bacteroidia bacterium]
MASPLTLLRNAMKELGVDACIIPSTDPHQSEYVADRWQARRYLTGFDGSAGTAVVTQDFAGLWTDSRYFIQAEKQLQGSGFELMKLNVPHTPEFVSWISDNLEEGSKVAVDGAVLSYAKAESFETAFEGVGIELVTDIDLIEDAWPDRPGLAKAAIYEHELQYAGVSREEKFDLLRKKMVKKGADYALLTALDDIAWLFNLRGADVDFNPVFVAYALVGENDIWLCVDIEKMPPELQQSLSNAGIRLTAYDRLEVLIEQLPKDSAIYLDPRQTSVSLLYPIWDHHGENEIEGPSLVSALKGSKNDHEQALVREVMVKDGVAMVHFIHWLETHIGKEAIRETTAAKKLLSFRSQQPLFVGESFPAISGYGPNGAIVHYRAQEGDDAELKPEGVYLIDSGGQYLDGTTDITRTLALGPVSRQAQEDFTRVLQGYIDLDMAIFPKGTSGRQLDILARKSLWDAGLNYGHGTGHGVGFFLNVHEGPQRISPGGNGVPLSPGMITSNEPGLYREGKYGMRMENLILVTKDGPASDFGTFYSFETLTLCPIDQNMIIPDLLSEKARSWLNQYHQMVFERLSPHVDTTLRAWLENACRAV